MKWVSIKRLLPRYAPGPRIPLPTIIPIPDSSAYLSAAYERKARWKWTK